ncbi:Esterase [Cavenderia fasciculata]|uniref:Esterase n=1 Tax=Cavenderia fasciculata TaxID=261658 RepID=F4PRA2_CACFS|nr:Esterase [Cavenderia fasciculata]EGG21302.1 Esterase [Cavenderia fasciculata]|eukprot:XP_004359152.1 Esterase [Cavenderia fasciculata]
MSDLVLVLGYYFLSTTTRMSFSDNPLNRSSLDDEGEEGDFVNNVSPFATSTSSSLSYPTSSSTTTTTTTSTTNNTSTTADSTIEYPPQQQQQQQRQQPVQQSQPQQQQQQQQPIVIDHKSVKRKQKQLDAQARGETIPQQQQQQQATTSTANNYDTSSPPAIKKPDWVPDNSSNKCEMCSSEFTFFNRRHHCRRCGHLFCGECCALNCSLPQEYGYTTRVKVCSKCFTTTLNDRAREETTITINVGGVSKETKVVSGLNKVLLWKMGAHEDGDFDRSIIDSLENYPSNAIPVSRVQDLMLEPSDLDVQGCTGFRVRIYSPSLEPGERRTNFPIVMWFHTGGFVSKSIETPSIDGLCRLLSNQSSCVVISVDYRLAPEHQFPAAALDCYAATCWAVKKAASFDGDPSRIVVAGDSVGGNLAAAVALMARDKESPRLAGQVLIYPILDLKRNEEKYYSRIVHQEGYLMPMAYFRWFSDKYCHQNDVDNIYASPIRASNTKIGLAGLPPAHVLTAGHDPFCDEGELYVKKLRSANVPVHHTRYTNSPHGFFAIGLDESNEAVMEVSIALKYMFLRK